MNQWGRYTRSPSCIWRIYCCDKWNHLCSLLNPLTWCNWCLTRKSPFPEELPWCGVPSTWCHLHYKLFYKPLNHSSSRKFSSSITLVRTSFNRWGVICNTSYFLIACGTISFAKLKIESSLQIIILQKCRIIMPIKNEITTHIFIKHPIICFKHVFWIYNIIIWHSINTCKSVTSSDINPFLIFQHFMREWTYQKIWII